MQFPAEFFVFVGVLLSSLLLLRWWNGLGRARRRYPPSLPSLPLVGSLPFIRGFNNIADFFMRKADQLGPIFTFTAGSKFVLILNNREVIEDALVSHSFAFSGRYPIYTESVVNPNNKGLITMNTTKEWKRYHQLSLSILNEFGLGVKSTMESRILTEFQFLTDYVLKLNGKSFNPRELVYISTSNIIMNIIFGRRHDISNGMSKICYETRRIIENFDLLLDVVPALRFFPFHRSKLRQIVESQNMFNKLLRIEIEESLEDGADDCFVRRYLERVGTNYDHEQLRFTLRDIIIAGTDTTANTVLWTMIALANNPDVQKRLRTEIDGVVSRDRLPSMNDQSRLPYVEATMLEIMRWKTLGPLTLPRMTLNDTRVGNYFVPARTLVLVNLYAAHMNPKVWKDPEVFRPERFLDEDGQVIGRESIIPFSLGRRSCLGQVLARAELFLVLSGLVQRFFIRPPEGQTTVDDKPIYPITAILTAAAFNVRLISTD